jgi:hypothetical protein
MKLIARFYCNNDYLIDGTTKYFVEVENCKKNVTRILYLMHSLRVLSESFIDEEKGQLQIEQIDYSCAEGDVLQGAFYNTNGNIIYVKDQSVSLTI